ncbi:MAG: NADPH:quinone oxidoreductase family protein [Myxococcota bacterium]
MRAWRVHAYGEPSEVLRLEEVPTPDPGPGQVQVRVEALAINYNDLDGILGRYRTVRPELPYIPGMEVVGRVEACGEGAEDWLGKRVCSTPEGAYGGYAEYAICAAAMTFGMPEDLPAPQAAAFYFPFHLSWLALFERGQLEADETVLIHAAAGGVGSAAVQLAQVAGARVLATAGSPEKVEFCRKLGADVAINYRQDAFAERVLEATDGRGVDVVFDSVGGEVTKESMRCMAFGARLLAVGFASGIETEDESQLTPRPWLFGNFSYCGVCHAYVDDPIAFKGQTGLNFPSHAEGVILHERVLGLLAEGKVETVIGQQFDFAELPEAFVAIQERTIPGRSIIVL